MSDQRYTCPLTRREVIDQYFLEHRAKMIDIAAFLDRIGRARPAEAAQDFRVKAMERALSVLTDNEGDKARRVLDVLSDPTVEPIAKSPGKGASGAYPVAT